MLTLYHLATDENDAPIPANFVDGNGKLYTIPPDTPTDIDSDFMAGKIMEHCHYNGIIQVHSTRDRAGVHFDMEDARTRALAALDTSEQQCINDYVRTQLEDRVRQNYPPLPPTGRSLTCIIKHKVDLRTYGIRPVGWQPPYDVPGGWATDTTPAQGSFASQGLETRLAQLETLIFQQQQILNELFSGKIRGREPHPRTDTAPVPAPAQATVGSGMAQEVEGESDQYEADQTATKTDGGKRTRKQSVSV